MVATERLALFRPLRTRQWNREDVERREILCVGCGQLLGVEVTYHFTDASYTNYGLIPGYRENALGVLVRRRPPRRGHRILLDEPREVTAARYYEPNEFGHIVGSPVIEHEHHLVGVMRRPPFTIECSWKLCNERNLIMGR